VRVVELGQLVGTDPVRVVAAAGREQRGCEDVGPHATSYARDRVSFPVMTVRSFLIGEWREGPTRATLVNPATEEPIAELAGGDVGGALAHARERGGPALGRMTFAERGQLLRALSRAVHAHRDELIGLAVANGGNTRSDAKFDIDGASGALAHYADLGEKLGAARVLVDGEGVQLGRSPRFFGLHARGARAGAAVLVNASNFPAGGAGAT